MYEPELNCQLNLYLDDSFDCSLEFYGSFESISIKIHFDDNEGKNLEFKPFNSNLLLLTKHFKIQ